MEYYLEEIREENDKRRVERHAGGKARADVAHTLDELGIKKIELYAHIDERKNAKNLSKIKWHIVFARNLKRILKKLNKGDVLYLQFPLLSHSILQGIILWYAQKNIKIVLIIHDLTMLREIKNIKSPLSKIRLWLEEKSVVMCCSKVVVHNSRMGLYLKGIGLNADKLINLQIFDYIVPEKHEIYNFVSDEAISEVIVAGNLEREKAGYVYNLPPFLKYNLYGVNYDGIKKENVHYFGSYKSDELPYVIRGKFGLVWDGPSADSCIGSYGEYLKINNPHKTSLYLAAGIPVAIWNEAALADFITENRCGILIESLKDLEIQVERMSEESYLDYKKNAERVGKKIREGFYLQKAIQESRKLLA
ncbi:hypothetical protein [uncultured Acetatifactor sp.]|uniref:hypothetical protein n=1 Tax=uncultured Acetatifactor sp. TaxID=1671927 RepID=UPI002616542B|nr:hypothetical protein [uncultured Acetatifactor sp.]